MSVAAIDGGAFDKTELSFEGDIILSQPSFECSARLMMSFESVWPVMTLIGGWLLGEVSGIIKSNRDRSDEFRLATYRVLVLLDDLDLFLFLCDQMPGDADKAGSIQKADDLRAQMFERWSNQLETIEKGVDTLTLPVARFDPTLAYNLHESLVTLRSLSKPRLKEVA